MPNDPWGGISPDNGGGTVGDQAAQNAKGSNGGGGPVGTDTFMDGSGNSYGANGTVYNANDPTGLKGMQNNGHSWNITDLWGGDNKYADWGLNPSSYAPQGDSNAFYDQLAKYYANKNEANAQGAFGNANAAWGQYMQNSADTQGMLAMLQGAANGTAPSAAQLQMQQGIQQSTAAQQALGNSARGGPGAWAAAQRNAANQMAQMQQTGIGQGAALRANEMAQARGAYANALNQYGAQALQAQQQMGAYGQAFQKGDMASMLALLGYGQTAGQIANQQENAWNNVVSGAASANAQNNATATAATAQLGAAALAAL